MPTVYIQDYLDVEIDEFVSSCSRMEIKELIEVLVNDGHIIEPSKPTSKLGREEEIFHESIDKFKQKYYTISTEDLSVLEEMFKKYI
jgi:hypothetical protein